MKMNKCDFCSLPNGYTVKHCDEIHCEAALRKMLQWNLNSNKNKQTINRNYNYRGKKR